MNSVSFVKEVARKKNISEQAAYQYVTVTIDTLRVILSRVNR